MYTVQRLLYISLHRSYVPLSVHSPGGTNLWTCQMSINPLRCHDGTDPVCNGAAAHVDNVQARVHV